MSAAGALPDQEARRLVAEDTARTLFVEAGAGSGKTRSLTDRVVTLVLRDRIPLSAVAAVTFTERAGAELRDRLRAEFESAWRTARSGVDSERERLAAEALDDLDGAAIGTLHSFAQRILTTHPIEAGLPPLVEVLDEVASSVAFDERWSVMQRRLLDDEAVSPALLLALSAGVTLDTLRSLTRALGDSWDLIEDRVLAAGRPEVRLPDPERLIESARALAARAGECTAADDRFLGRLTELADWYHRAIGIDDSADMFAHLNGAAALKFSYGRRQNWPDLEGLREECRQWQSEVATITAEYANATLRPLAFWIAERVLEAAAERTAEGRLEFHDLLVLARRLLRRNADVRQALHLDYRVLLLDEFQDTDPIQLELAVRIAGGRDAGDPEWSNVAVPHGSLFVVGDPKQSIYRFRRASIGTYLRAQEWFGDTVSLTANFRAVAPVVDWVNEVFARLIEPHPQAQPDYRPLQAFRDDRGVGPAVAVIGADPHQDGPNADLMREREARDVAAAIGTALSEGWTVRDRDAPGWRPIRLGDIAILIPARTSLPFLEDALEAAAIPFSAESSSLVYQAGEVRDLMAAARTLADPTDLLSCVTALRSPLFACGDDDLWEHKRTGGSFSILAPPSEERSSSPVGAALDYLRRLHRAARWMSPSEVLTRIIVDRRMFEVAAAGRRPQDSWRRLRFVVDQARAWSESEHGGLRGYLAWAARQGEDASRVPQPILPETDVDAVRVMTVHAAKGLEFPMVVLSGLSSAPRAPSGVQVLWPPTGGYAVKLTKSVQTNDFEAAAPLDEQMDALERRRLLYVAATRARDHLVVSLHRKPPTGAGRTNAQLLAEAGADGAGAVALRAPESPGRRPAGSAGVTPPPDWNTWLAGVRAAGDASRRPGAITASGLEGTDPPLIGPDPSLADTEPPVAGAAPDDLRATAPSTPAGVRRADSDGEPSADSEVRSEVDSGADPAGLAKGPRDLELPPWSKGRYGTAIGRAVHAVLQSIDLADGSGIEEAVLAQCVAEGVTGHAPVVRGLAASALASPVVQRAATRAAWRESWVATTMAATSTAGPSAVPPGPPQQPADRDPAVLEGIVDLLYREDDGTVVIVDYKTDAVPAAALPARAAYYGPQIRAYAAAVSAATGAPVSGILLFLHPERPAVAIDVPLAPEAPSHPGEPLAPR
jgi:ATP-dependent exoDNAse (exonuclease V) beta subunit